MTQQEALLYFPMEEDEELADAFELNFFNWKSKLFQSPFLYKLYHAKWKKLGLMFEAYSVLSGENIQSNNMGLTNFKLPVFSGELISDFNLYTQKLLQLKKKVWDVQSYQDLGRLFDQMFVLRDAYLQQFDQLSSQEDVLLSKEMDSMQFLEGLKQLANLEIKHSSQLSTFEFNHDKSLEMELKRLSLLPIKDQNGGFV